MFRNKVRREKGLTAIELLIIASIVALVAVFAAPMLSKAIFRTEFQEAVNITETSIDRARETAKFYKTDVLLQFGTGEGGPQNVIRLTIPELQRDETMNEVGEEFLLPASTQIYSERRAAHFNAEGELESGEFKVVLYNRIRDQRQTLEVD